jgi:hypothetical protein
LKALAHLKRYHERRFIVSGISQVNLLPFAKSRAKLKFNLATVSLLMMRNDGNASLTLCGM